MVLHDVIAFTVFVGGITAYSILKYWSSTSNKNTQRKRLEQYRKSWLEERLKKNDQITIVQTIRNTIMSSSILASASIVSLPLIFSQLKLPQDVSGFPEIGSANFKLMLLMAVLLYAAFMILLHLRLLQRFTLLAGSRTDALERGEKREPLDFLAEMLNKAYREFANAMRALAFAVAVMAWFFNTYLFIAATIFVTILLSREDLLVE